MKNYLLPVIFIFSLFIAACSDDTTSPNGGGSETVVFSQDSLVLYSDTVSQGDTLLNYLEISSTVLNNPNLTGSKTCKLTFTSVTNDSTNSVDTASSIFYRISTYTGIFPNQQFTIQQSDSLKGNLINTTCQNMLTVNIIESYGFRLYIKALFKNRYHFNKYIKLYNIKFTQY